MKKFSFKNCIAFTLTEMTIVLLIMSVLAAASAPIITKSISDSKEKIYSSAPSPLWNKFTNRFGIYSTTSGVVSIGMVPSNSNTLYNNPALTILSAQGTYSSILKYPQIISLYRKDGSLQSNPLGLISMDAFGNLAVTTNSFHPTYYRGSATNIGHGGGNVFLGNELFKLLGSDSDTQNSVFLGTQLASGKSSNSIYIGNDVTSDKEDYNNILIGYGIYQKDGNAGLLNNIYIGESAGFNTNSAYNIKIGTYSGAAGFYIAPTSTTNSNIPNTQNRSVSIGAYSGVNSELYATDAISIGSYAGQKFGDDDINIGTKAGLRWNTINNSTVWKQDNISIGYAAGYKMSNVALVDANNISIGYGASSHSAASDNTIAIGADSMRYGGTNNIAIGSRAGYASTDSIYIGSYAGSYYNTTATFIYANMIIMGYYAGTSTYLGHDSILIGPYAGYGGYNGTSNPLMKHQYSIALGYASCMATDAGTYYTNLYKSCVGMGAPKINNTYWPTGVPQTVIGNMFYSMANNYITLYAGTTYGPTSNVTLTSDKRLKENIVPSKHSLSDIRKVNIYNFNFKDDKEKLKIGVIAQEYKKVFPNGVVLAPDSKYLAVKPEWLLFSAVNAVKELDKSIQNLETSLKNYINDFMGLKSRVAKLEKQSAQLRQQNAYIKARLNSLK